MAEDTCQGDQLTSFALSRVLEMCTVILRSDMQTNTRTLPYHVHKLAGLTDIEATGVIVLIYNGVSNYGSIIEHPGWHLQNFAYSE